MFGSGLKESTLNIVEIVGTDSDTMSALVNYIYSSNIEINTENVQTLVQASDQFRFTALVDRCEDFMVKQISPANAIGFYKFSADYHLMHLREASRSHMLGNFPDVVRSTEFSNMNADEIIEYISDNGLKVPTEDAVFEAVGIWVKSDVKGREPSFPKIAEHIRFPLCSPSYLSKKVARFHLMKEEGCYKYMEEALMYHMMPQNRHRTKTPRTTPRNTIPIHSCLVVVSGVDKDNRNSPAIKYLKDKDSSWEALTKMPSDLRLFNAVGVQRGIFISGGHSVTAKNECWLFDLAEKQWHAMPPMTYRRFRHGNLARDEHVYIVGGQDSIDRAMYSVERYDQKKGLWTCLPNMPRPLKENIVLNYDQYVCVFSHRTLDLLIYDTVWERWLQRRAIPLEMSVKGCSAVTVNDKIYVAGGYTRSCMMYDLYKDSWSKLTSPRDQHGFGSATLWQGKILVTGGFLHGNVYTSAVEEYNIEDDTWSFADTPLPCELVGHHLLTLDICTI